MNIKITTCYSGDWTIIEVDGRISTSLRKAHSKDYEIIGNIYDRED